MKILIFGDIVGRTGRDAVKDYLERYKHDYDFVIANGENAASGFGLTNKVADELFRSGIDVITSGNHIWDKRDIVYYMKKAPTLLRPLNYGEEVPGVGFCIVEKQGKKIAVVNIQGRVFMPPVECPFKAIKQWLETYEAQCDVIIVDFHAEATSEKIAMGWYLDGRATLMFGTHTHVQTADHKILPKGTGYLSDVGMCGSFNSILGMKKDNIIDKFFDNLPTRFEVASDNKGVNALSVTLNDALKIEQLTPINLQHM